MDNTETYIKMWTAAEFTEAPRQDQLQEMVMPAHPDEAYQLVSLLGNFREWFLASLKERFTSMEQLWLAFVMKEKYNKTWDGGKWK